MPQPNQLDKLREDVDVSAADLLRPYREDAITEAGLRHNIRVGIQYLGAWLRGRGCVPLYNLMEDAATAEISRAQVWQWIHHDGASLDDGRGDRRPLPRHPRRGAREASASFGDACAHQERPLRRGSPALRAALDRRRLRRVPDPARLRVPGFGARRSRHHYIPTGGTAYRPPVRASRAGPPAHYLTRSEKVYTMAHASYTYVCRTLKRRANDGKRRGDVQRESCGCGDSARVGVRALGGHRASVLG